MEPNNPKTLVANLSPHVNNRFRWIVQNGNCTGFDEVRIFRYLPPSEADIIEEMEFCNIDTVQLAGNTPVVGKGTWSMLSGNASFDDLENPNTYITQLSSGENILQYTISNGVCEPSTDQLRIINHSAVEHISAGTYESICDDELTLNADHPLEGTGIWTILSDNNEDALVENQNNPSSIIRFSKPGTYKLAWTITNGTCSNADTITLDIFNKISEAQIASENYIEMCSTYDLQLEAKDPEYGTGSWSSDLYSVYFSNENSYNTSVYNLQEGENILVWTVNNGFCENKDTVTIVVTPSPGFANGGPNLELYESTGTLQATTPLSGTGKWIILQGEAEISDATSAVTEINNVAIGENILAWVVSNGNCPNDTATVLVKRRELSIPNAFSPNDDAVNDTFIIRGLEKYGPAKFNVMNRWGDEVYYSDNYKNDWNGDGHRGELPEDTYYYTLQLNNGSVYKGFIMIKRK